MKPLVIRANAGEKVVISFSHSLNRELSIHVLGMAYDVQTSDGANVGFNQSTTTRNRITYTWYAAREGVYLFHDMGDTRSSEEGTNTHGLFGAIIVESPQSRWLDPQTGAELESGLFADIYPPGKPAFREYAVFFHDELEIRDKNGKPPTDPHTGLPASTTGISYRSEPMRNRPPLTNEHSDSGEDISMSSWVYGDPAPPILRAYVGDPAKIRLIHGGVKETHVFHLHNHQWRLEGENPVSTILDSITLSPQECYTLDILHGAGSLTETIGDVIFHCHLYPHFHEGMWTLWRIHDRLEDGTGELPDGTKIPPLLPLMDRAAPPPKDEEHPGYPHFINGTFGQRPLQPPLGILNSDGSNKIEPTDLEQANFVENFVPGALYSETCPCHANEPKVFEIALIQAKVTYNSYGWNDPQGRFFVLKEDLEYHGGLDAYTLHNLFNPSQPVEFFDYPRVPLDLRHQPSMRVSLNPQFLNYDPICDSGINVGYNNREQTVGPGESKKYLWYADKEYGSCIIHSFGDMRNHRYHGLFGTILIEPAGASWYRNFSFSRVIPLQGGISIGNTFNIEIKNGTSVPGDYLYRSGSLKWDIESGMWGIFRVMRQGWKCRIWKRLWKDR